jgi:hypothetical protein
MGSKKQKSGWEEFAGGLVFTIIFGFVWLRNPSVWVWLFPFAFAGVMPALQGLSRIISQRFSRKLSRENRKALERSKEKEILKVASRHRGSLTAAIVALETELSIEESEKELQRLVQLGQATVDVTDDGRMTYEFPDFR